MGDKDIERMIDDALSSSSVAIEPTRVIYAPYESLTRSNLDQNAIYIHLEMELYQVIESATGDEREMLCVGVDFSRYYIGKNGVKVWCHNLFSSRFSIISVEFDENEAAFGIAEILMETRSFSIDKNELSIKLREGYDAARGYQ